MAFRVLPLLTGFVAVSALAAAPAPGDGRFVPGSELDGTWEGILSNGGMGLPMIFVITTTPGEGTKAVLDVMDQAAKDIPVVGYRREKDTVFMEIPAVGGKFDGLVSGDLAAISGRWTQAGAAGSPVPLILHRKAP
ncbi:MAG: hypothetical protein IT566_11565 [Rhodospirillaceae bacterium]|nr:hypothetical protein [Rhodospirillaceae bacterium]